MRISELLISIASWLENPNNEALLLSEYDDNCLAEVTASLVLASNEIRKCADIVDSIEPEVESKLDPAAIDDLAMMASAFDQSGDLSLIKQAGLIDELLLTVAANPEVFKASLAKREMKMDELKRKYHDSRQEYIKINKLDKAADIISKSDYLADRRPLENPLQTRSCPDHAGSQMQRVAENEFKCSMDGKVYNYLTGYSLENGDKVPGTSVELQTKNLNPEIRSVFDTRQERLQTNKI